MSKEEFSPTVELNEIKEKAIEGGNKLADFCARNGNPINIIDYGGYFDPKEINLLEEEDLNKYSLSVFKSYLNGMFFTDNLPEDDVERNAWEQKLDVLTDENLKDSYKSNRIKINKYHGVIGMLDFILKNLENPEILNKLQSLRNEIKEELPELEERNENNSSTYVFLEKGKKVELIKKFSEIVFKIVSVLENKA